MWAMRVVGWLATGLWLVISFFIGAAVLVETNFGAKDTRPYAGAWVVLTGAVVAIRTMARDRRDD